MRTSRPAHGNRPAPARKRLAGRAIVATLAALFLLALCAGPAAADVADVVAGLKENPVYVDPAAEAQIDQGRVLERVRDADTAIYIAILPRAARDQTGGSIGDLGRGIANGLRRNGTYLVISGTDVAAANYVGAIPP